MANKFQVKRTSTTGRTPNTTNAANTQYIAAGEFALNMTDQILYTSDGSNLITVGANSTKYSISGYFTVNTSVLTVNSATFYNTNLQQAPSSNFAGNSYATLGGSGSNYLALGQYPSTFGQWIQSGYPSVSSPVYYSIHLNPLGGKVTVGTNTAPTNTFTVTGTSYFSDPVTIKNDTLLQFQTVNSSAYAGFKQQSDDNFVFYTTNTSYGTRAVFSIFANSITSNLAFSVPVVFNTNVFLGSAPLSANGSYGTAGQVLSSNGTATYWASQGAASVNVQAQYTWTNLHTFQANVSFTGNGTSVVTNTGAYYFNGISDSNWKIGRNVGSLTKTFYTGNTIDIVAYSSPSTLEGIALGNGPNTFLETGYNGTYTANPIYIGNGSVNVTINSTSFTGTANNTLYVGSVTAANVVSNNQLASNLANYQTTAGLASNVATLAANSATYVKANSGIVSNSSGVFVDQKYQYSWSNTQTFTNTITFNSNLVVNAISANGTIGANNQVLKSNGSISYWANDNFINLNDVPTSYVGYANAFVVVNPNANGLTFATDLSINNFNFTAVSAPNTPAPSSVTVYLTASGVSPNMEVAWKIKNELGEEVILSSILV